MNSFDFGNIVNEIMATEHVDLTELAKKTNANRSYLSKVINSTVPLKIGPRIINKIRHAYPSYFHENNKNNEVDLAFTGKNSKTYLVQSKEYEQKAAQEGAILERLSKAFVDQAEGFKAQAEAFKAQAELLIEIRKEMAREKTQAIIKDKVDDLTSNLENLWNGLFVASTRQAVDRESVLEVLSKLSGKPADHFLKVANKKAAEIFEASGVPDKIPVKRK